MLVVDEFKGRFERVEIDDLWLNAELSQCLKLEGARRIVDTTQERRLPVSGTLEFNSMQARYLKDNGRVKIDLKV